MGLMTGTGPLGRNPTGSFNFETPPAGKSLYIEPTPKRIRVEVDGETIADSRRAVILQESGLQPVYYFPPDDVRTDLFEPTERHTKCPTKGEASYYSIRVGEREVKNGAWYYPEPIEGAEQIAGMIAFYWDRVDRWLEEDEEILVHPRDPYHRIDVLPSSRHVRISLEGELLAESTRPIALFESNLPSRWYLPREDVLAELEPTETVTHCGYKGQASYYAVRLGSGDTVPDLVWTYTDPFSEAGRIQNLLCFFNERVDIELDGEPQERPVSAWSRGVKETVPQPR
jgi:uncharacterized protein (DUF427 family)